jgi:hypothetical protein
VGKLAKRSGARFPTAAGGRSSGPRSNKTVGERDRRRSHEISPNSRQSRCGVSRRVSSHSQGRDIVMDVAFKSFVGIDIAKRTLDVHVLPERTSLKQQNDSKGRGQLREKLPAPGVCLIVVEATGGYERALVAELIDAGYQVAVVNPRQARDFAKLVETWPRPIASTWPCWHASAKQSSCGPRPKSRKNWLNCKISSSDAGSSSSCEPQK